MIRKLLVTLKSPHPLHNLHTIDTQFIRIHNSRLLQLVLYVQATDMRIDTSAMTFANMATGLISTIFTDLTTNLSNFYEYDTRHDHSI